jgi:hypothetical protein
VWGYTYEQGVVGERGEVRKRTDVPLQTWTYYPMVPLPQSVTDNLMETDQEGAGGGRRGHPKERMQKGTDLTE